MLLSIIMIGKEEAGGIPLPKNVELLNTRGFDIPSVVRKAKGEFIVFIKEDDEITVKYLEDVLQVCESNLCDLCFINYSVKYEGADIKLNTYNKELNYKLLPGEYIWAFIYRRKCFLKVLELKDKNETEISKIFKRRSNIPEVIYIHNPHNRSYVKDFFLTDVKPEYRYTNLIYIGDYICGLFNGYVSWFMNMGRCFKNKNITIVYNTIHPDIYNKLIKYFRCVKYDNSCNYVCDRFITTYSTYYYPKNFIPLESSAVFIHGILSFYFKKGESIYKHDLYDQYIAVSKTAAKEAKGFLPTDKIDYILNPINIPKELVKPHLYLVSTLRGSSKLKGLDKIKALASIFDEEEIPYTWDVFTDVETNTNRGGLIFRNSVVNPLPYVKDADYFVLLSESEACSYSMLEALMLNVKVIAIHLLLYDELGFTGSKNTTYIPLNYFKSENKEKLRNVAKKIYKNKDYIEDYHPDIEFRKGYNKLLKSEKKLIPDKKISIIVPCYNSEKTIDRCLRALINQTYKNLEIICVDDGSSDNTVKKLKEYSTKDKRIKYIENKHGGASAARNTGIDNSTGDYVMFCDSDDYYTEDACESLLRDMLKYNVDVVRGRHKFENGKVDCYYNYYGLYDIYKIRDKIIPGLLDGGVLGFAVLLLIKKEVLNRVRFDEDIMMMEDKVFSLNLYLNVSSVYQSDKVIYNYIVSNPNSVSSDEERKIKRIKDIINVYLITKKLLCQNGLYSKENESKLIYSHYYMFSREIENIKDPKSRNIIIKELEKLSKNEEYNYFINHVEVGKFTDKELIIYNYLIERDYKGLLDHLLMKDKISVVIPVHNDRKTLKRCLDSIVNQTYKNLEIIIVDGSTDSSLKIARKYQEKDKRIKIITGEDKGAGRAKTAGFKKATGKFIGVVDADDYIELNMYEKMHDMAVLNEVDLVRCQYYLHDNSESRQSYNSVYGVIENEEALDLFLKKLELSSNWAFLYKKELVEGLDFGNFAYVEDFYFNFMAILRAKRIYISNEALYNYDTVSKDNSSRKYGFDKTLIEIDAHLGVDNAIYKALEDRKKYRITSLENTFNGFVPSIKSIIFNETFDKYKEFIKDVKKLDSFKTFNRHRGKYKQDLYDKIFVNYKYYYEVKKINK